MLDGQKVAETDRCEYIFTDVASGAHVASVKAVYASGESEPAEVVFGESGIDSALTGGIAVSPNPAPGYTLVSITAYFTSGAEMAVFIGMPLPEEMATSSTKRMKPSGDTQFSATVRGNVHRRQPAT